MNENAGLASVFSVVIVAVFAILLHDRPTATRPNSLSPPSTRQDVGKPLPTPEVAQASTPVQRPQTASPRTAPAPPASTPARTPQVAATRKPSPPSTATAAATPSPSPAPPSQVAASGKARVESPRLPKAPFTVVEAGERLAEVAARIYGSRDQAETLWRANRDQVASIDAPLRGGTLIRTP